MRIFFFRENREREKKIPLFSLTHAFFDIFILKVSFPGEKKIRHLWQCPPHSGLNSKRDRCETWDWVLEISSFGILEVYVNATGLLRLESLFVLRKPA